MRYVGRYRRAAIQCRERNIRMLSPGTGLLRTCNVLRIAGVPVLRNDGAPSRRTPRTARSWTGGLGLDCFARLAMTGQGEALPCPGAVRRDRGRGLRNPGEARCVAPTYWFKPTGRV
ncbi:MAG: hypothetical protein LBM98_02170 [Oscillospiraceae bacterium]|nr:hypothetical protein [Oscillospiraceae bacterium]